MFFTKKSEKGASLKYLKKYAKKITIKIIDIERTQRDIWQRRGWLNRDNGREKTTIFKFPAFCKGQLISE
jgi:hypothetical protein